MNWLRISLLVVLGFSAACSDSDDDVLIRFVHAASDAPPVDVYVEGDDEPIVSGLAYGVTSEYRGLAAGTYVFEIRAAGADPSTDPVFATGALILLDGERITAVAAGLLAAAPGSLDAFRVLALGEGFGQFAGQIAARVVHAGADAPTVGIDVNDDDTVEVPALARFADTGELGVGLPASTTLQVGIVAAGERVTGFTVPGLAAGTEVFLIATGLLGSRANADDGFGILAVGPDGTIGFLRQNPVVYVLHASPDADPVDVFAGTTELVDNIAFSELSDPFQVPPASYELEVRLAAGGALAATVNTPALAAGETYLVTATGFVSTNPSFRILALADAFGEDASQALVVIQHASPDAGPVDVGAVNGAFTPVPDFTGLNFEASSPAVGTGLGSSPITVGVAPATTNNPVATFDLAPQAGDRLIVVAAGALGEVGQSFRLIAIDTTLTPWAAVVVSPNANG